MRNFITAFILLVFIFGIGSTQNSSPVLSDVISENPFAAACKNLEDSLNTIKAYLKSNIPQVAAAYKASYDNIVKIGAEYNCTLKNY